MKLNLFVLNSLGNFCFEVNLAILLNRRSGAFVKKIPNFGHNKMEPAADTNQQDDSG